MSKTEKIHETKKVHFLFHFIVFRFGDNKNFFIEYIRHTKQGMYTIDVFAGLVLKLT